MLKYLLKLTISVKFYSEKYALRFTYRFAAFITFLTMVWLQWFVIKGDGHFRETGIFKNRPQASSQMILCDVTIGATSPVYIELSSRISWWHYVVRQGENRSEWHFKLTHYLILETLYDNSKYAMRCGVPSLSVAIFG